jgi:RNA 3'-terminal phosphate cyclase (ATP)
MDTVVDIDGSVGEGGGQVVRTALALSVLTGKPTRIGEIRAGRSKPGLAPQHLTVVRALAEVCGASVEGARIGSTEVRFEPASPARPGDYVFDVSEAAKGGSAGSVTLVLQALLLPLALSGATSHLTLKGGTHVSWSPPFEFITEAYLPVLGPMGLSASCRLVAWGFYPVGGGRIAVEIRPAAGFAPLELTDRGELKRIRGRAVACNLPSHIPVRMVNRARNLLADLDAPLRLEPERVRGKGPGAAFFLAAEYEGVVAGFSALGARGKPAPDVAEEACAALSDHDENGAPVTPHLADQILLPASLAKGRTVFRTSRITRHLLTNADIIREFLPAHIDVVGSEGSPGEVSIDGAGS